MQRSRLSLCWPLFVLFVAGCGSDSNRQAEAPPEPPAPAMTWEAPALFSELHQGFQGGRLVADANGNMLLAWTRDSHVWASSSSDGATWSTPEQVDDATLRAGARDLTMNSSGEAVLVWHAEETTGDYFKARLYTPSTGWETSPQSLDALTSDGTGVTVDMNDAGDVMVALTRYDASGHLWARSRTETGGWDTAATRLDAGASVVNYPDVAVDAGGKATVVWEQWDGARNQALARSYTPGTGWDAAATALDGSGDPSIEKIRIALGADGNGLAHWTLADRTGLKVRRLVGGAWQEVETVATGTGIYASEPRIAPDGRIVQAWSDYRNVYAKVFADGAWETDATLVSDDAETVNLRSWVGAMDQTNGRAIVLWSRLALNDADGSAVWARRYDPVDGWSPVENVVPWTPGILFDVDSVVLGDDGRALAVLAGEDISVWEYSTYLIGYR